ncbi:Gfo/Idh/MocA family protein [Herbiconiux sp. L3-i23]|uniref:Gfo/Idh/MocA family protein n=1 Tax=Herbiconiux sp. L3-i23 TaxID=2905871 RepID=UPI0020545047|nr:Gfo/Idh/MocA family oxidoreductase [Herbiconiux sp. L3-i23]BDI21778.1 dehydrogenase [Herbiconiux sp. L3-i23]
MSLPGSGPSRSGLPGSNLGVGIIGGGFMAAVHSRAARAAGARLVGLSSSTLERASAAAEALGVERAFASAEQLLADDAIDVVHICTPNATHAALASAALAAGKHVICEKPLATEIADAERLVGEAEASGLVTAIPFVYRFHPMARAARDRVRGGAAGRLLTVSGSYLQDWLLEQGDDNWRVDDRQGGRSRAFGDIGSHLVDLFEFVGGDPIVAVAAKTSTVFASRGGTENVNTEDAVAVAIETESGAIGTLLVSQVAPGRKNALVLELAGTAESIRFEQENPEQLWIGRRAGSELLLRDPGELTGDAARLSVLPGGHPLGYQDAFSAFAADVYATIRGDEVDGVASFADGLRAMRITEAVLDSARDGAWVRPAA